MTDQHDEEARPEREFPVFIKRGDARGEVDALIRELGLPPAAAGLHKYIHVTQANQTVLMVTDRAAPLAAAVRGRAGWIEPSEAQ